ncbi:sulfotransferase family protein [Hasllibacter halocynthiae]|uniref:Sulfotransferase family protein n=1 Tax=Hasllibacter halocynthiae TaxID=595589 RepID=A0A2T0X6G3_9RHOB|nr:sulfotransferase family 2 domain-containing protein [Hasllibacter halocynthiae]PRY94513.1 sulfotransferase family protein [Hasllibacter halocynthiae]
MHISPGRNFIFVHIPKTGGTSMSLALEDRAQAADILIGDTPKARRRAGRHRGVPAAGRLWKHSTLRDVPGLVDQRFVDGAFVFTLIRNPWDRLLSWHAWLGRQSFDHPAVASAKTRTLGDFLREPSIRAMVAANPPSAYVTTARGEERCAAYVRLEHYPQDVAPIAEHLGFVPEMPHANRSHHPVRQDAYDDATRALVETLCPEEIGRFGYRF